MDYNLIFDGINAVGSLTASILGGAALIYSMVTYTKSLKISHYNELDRNYQKLLYIAFRYPYLTNPEKIKKPEEQQKYDLYAFMVWNFLEAIYDKCQSDKVLHDTWIPIIEVEGEVHYQWFCQPENKPKFKPVFAEYIDSVIAGNKGK